MDVTGGRGVPRPGDGPDGPALAVPTPRHWKADMGATLYVCTTCKAGTPVPEGELPPGLHLYAALKRAGAAQVHGVTLARVVRPVALAISD